MIINLVKSDIQSTKNKWIRELLHKYGKDLVLSEKCWIFTYVGNGTTSYRYREQDSNFKMRSEISERISKNEHIKCWAVDDDECTVFIDVTESELVRLILKFSV